MAVSIQALAVLRIQNNRVQGEEAAELVIIHLAAYINQLLIVQVVMAGEALIGGGKAIQVIQPLEIPTLAERVVAAELPYKITVARL